MEYLIELLPSIVWIFTAVCWWKIFSKANIAGWKAIIPFYSDYVKYKLAGKANMYFIYLLVTIGKQIMSVVSLVVLTGNFVQLLADGTFNGAGIEMKMVSWGLTLVIALFDVYIGKRIAVKFGKSESFGVGMGLLPIVFVPILAFGDAEYQEKEWI